MKVREVVAATLHKKTQMHRIGYSALTEAQIGRALAAASKPGGASAFSSALAGRRLKIVTDDGPTLSYRFTDNGHLQLQDSENGMVRAEYRALTLHHVTLFSHLIPGTLHGYVVVLDADTGLATVFDHWFGGDIWVSGGGRDLETIRVPREVQREVYFGYVEGTSGVPQARMVRTNRVEGRGYHWRQDNGTETLEYFPSKSYSNFVELTRFGPEMSFCAPSDYVQIDEKLFIHQRTECEFSGAMTIYVFDSNRIEQIGVRLGFDERDQLDYYLFRGTGEWLGQIAQYEAFGDTSGTPSPTGPNGEELPKGSRRVFRPKRTFDELTRDEVAALAATKTRPFDPTHLTHNSQQASDYLVGREITMRWDAGPTIEYRFESVERLVWRKGGGAWQRETYRAWESAPDVVFFSHFVTGAPDHDAYIMVADFSTGLATMLHGTMGTEYVANEASVKTVFGVVEAEGVQSPKGLRHRLTDEIVGRALTWNYEPGLTSMHLYSTPTSVSWIIMGEDGSGGMEWSGAASYVKIRDGIFLAYWLEEASGSPLGAFLINMKTMHNCGVTYSCKKSEGLRLSPLGAHSRHTGQFDVRKFFNVTSGGGRFES